MNRLPDGYTLLRNHWEKQKPIIFSSARISETIFRHFHHFLLSFSKSKCSLLAWMWKSTQSFLMPVMFFFKFPNFWLWKWNPNLERVVDALFPCMMRGPTKWHNRPSHGGETRLPLVHLHSDEMVWGQRTGAAPKCKSPRDPGAGNYISELDERTESIRRSKVHRWEESHKQAQGFPKMAIPLATQRGGRHALNVGGYRRTTQRAGSWGFLPACTHLCTDLIGLCCRVCQQNADM